MSTSADPPSNAGAPGATDATQTQPRWFVIALAVGSAVGALPAALGLVLALLGNAVDLCQNEMGCFVIFSFGVWMAPFAFIAGAAASGAKARRLTSNHAPPAATWRQCFGVGLAALIPAAILAFLAILVIGSLRW